MIVYSRHYTGFCYLIETECGFIYNPIQKLRSQKAKFLLVPLNCCDSRWAHSTACRIIWKLSLLTHCTCRWKLHSCK